MNKLLLIFLIIICLDCDDVFETNGIYYPEEGKYGKNLLSEKYFPLINGENYSLNAQLEDNTILEVNIYFGNDNWYFYFMGTNPIFHWLVDSGIDSNNNEYRIFIAEAGEKNDMAIYFENHDTVYMEIYENGKKILSERRS